MESSAILIALKRAERRLLERLRTSGATSPERAQPLPDRRMLEGGRLERLLDAGAVVEAAPGRFWVNDAAYADQRDDRKLAVWAMLGAGTALAVWLALRQSR